MHLTWLTGHVAGDMSVTEGRVPVTCTVQNAGSVLLIQVSGILSWPITHLPLYIKFFHGVKEVLELELLTLLL